MFLLDDILKAPAQGLIWVVQELHKAAQKDRETEAAQIRNSLRELYLQVEQGVITDDEFDLQEIVLLDRLDAIESAAKDASGEAPGGLDGSDGDGPDDLNDDDGEDADSDDLDAEESDDSSDDDLDDDDGEPDDDGEIREVAAAEVLLRPGPPGDAFVGRSKAEEIETDPLQTGRLEASHE